jgi:hypothetical protein
MKTTSLDSKPQFRLVIETTLAVVGLLAIGAVLLATENVYLGIANPENQAAAAAGPAQDNRTPKIRVAWFDGNKLILVGEGFDMGAAILIDGLKQNTRNEFDARGSRLIAKKAGKLIAPGQVRRLQVRNSDGLLSEEILFYSGCRD